VLFHKNELLEKMFPVVNLVKYGLYWSLDTVRPEKEQLENGKEVFI